MRSFEKSWQKSDVSHLFWPSLYINKICGSGMNFRFQTTHISPVNVPYFLSRCQICLTLRAVMCIMSITELDNVIVSFSVSVIKLELV